MSSEWYMAKVEEIAAPYPTALATGPFGSAISSKYFVESGVPVIRGANLSADTSARLIDDGLVFVSHEKASEFKRSVAKRGDLIFTCWGTINQVGLIDHRSKFDSYIVSNKQMKLTIDPSKADQRFIYYVFSGPAKQNEILENGIGSSVPGFNLGQLKRHEISLPPVEEQMRIADFLETFDDRIALLRETNATFEAIAQALFKSWFVDFDPVRANAGTQAPNLPAEIQAQFPSRLVESPQGLIPEGWGWSTIAQSFILTMGQSPPGDTYNEIGDGLPFYQGKTDYGFRFPTQRVFCTSPTRLAHRGDCLVSVRAPVGDVNVALENCALGRGVAGVRHPRGFTSYVLYTLQLLKPHFEHFNGEGTVFGSINKKDFQNLPVIEAPESVLKAFDEIVSGIDAQIENNELKLRTLVNLRDTLLPRLISGQLRLPEAEAALAGVS